MIYCKQNKNMNSQISFAEMERPQRWFTLALDNLSIDDLENWSMFEDALKQRKKDLKQELRDTKAKERALEKEVLKKQKKEEKEQKKKLSADEKDKANDYEKTRESLQAIIMRVLGSKQRLTNLRHLVSITILHGLVVLREMIMLVQVLLHKKNLMLVVDAGNGRKLNGQS